MKKILLILICLVNIITFASSEKALNAFSLREDAEDVDTYTNASKVINSYTDFYNKNKNSIVNTGELTFTLNDYKSTSEEVISKDNSYGYNIDVIKIANKQSYTFNLNVSQSGLYEIYFDYYFLTSSILTTEASLYVNDEYQYYEAQQLIFEADWEPTTSDYKIDRYGNEIVPSSKRVEKWYLKKALKDGSLLHSSPLLIKLDNSKINEVKLLVKTGEVLIGNVYLNKEQENISYSEYINNYKNEYKNDLLIKVPAEYLQSKTDISVRQYATRDVSANRYDSVNRLLNCIYHDSWRKGNQGITWEIDVPKAGLYNLSFKYYQTGLIDLPTQRSISINNQIPFKELESYNFYYSKNWTNESIHNDDGLMYIYLNEGINTITMTVSLDFYRFIIESLDKIMDEMTDLSLQIKYLTNGQEDQYREWKMTEYIPNLANDLTRWSEQIQRLIDYGNTISSNRKGSSSYANLRLAIKKLNKLAEDPNSVPNELNNFTDGTSSASQLIGNTISSLRESPLGLEMIYLGGEGVKIPKPKANFFVRIWEGIKRFILSFFNEEYSVEDAESDELEIWVNRSRQYIEIMQQLADDAGYKVKFSIMPDESKLILANSSGSLPDIAMGVSNWITYDLAIRGIPVNLRQFSGYEETVAKMSKGTLIPYAYEDGIYGLPETQDFWVLYTRSDIFGRMNFTIPNTWDELLKLLPRLQSMGLNFYSPISAYTGLKPFVATIPFLYQFGGSLYTEDGMSTTLDSEANIEALKIMTNLFTIYNVPEEVPNFYNSFRQGTLPIGIANSSTYVQLTVAAPEIQGNWSISPHIGNSTENGVVRYSTSNSQGLVMFKSCERQEEAFNFIKWWLSTPTQTRFIETLYSIYGQEYLYFPSNNEAFEVVPIPTNHKDVIREQFTWAAEASRIPASYMVERSISDAFSKIVFNGVNPRIALDDAAIDSNREIIRKMEEFGYMSNGKKVRDYIVPTIYNIDDWLTELR